MFDNPNDIVVAISAFLTGLLALVFLPACLNGIANAVKDLYKAGSMTVRNKH